MAELGHYTAIKTDSDLEISSETAWGKKLTMCLAWYRCSTDGSLIPMIFSADRTNRCSLCLSCLVAKPNPHSDEGAEDRLDDGSIEYGQQLLGQVELPELSQDRLFSISRIREGFGDDLLQSSLSSRGPEKGVDCDNFQISVNISPRGHLIQSKDNKCLFLDDENLLRACDIPKSSELSCKFFLHMYMESTSNSAGRAAILYSNKEKKKMVVCCNERNEIYSQEMDLPDKIAESKHNAVFYLRALPASNMYTFESSAYLGKFLGFEPVENNPSMKKLVLHSKSSDEVDDHTQFKIVSKD
ncbi:uncharacterized protein LOC114868033 [Betta splendens]|uniref:Uncharacterized protein LOC114868033 n=1 Tax=Betta splendens TaxID=158456 RepID=A0A9W2Y810_BETSP|nr:uncharacterized protein LOC114868033 [Betta splendens]